MDPVVSTILRVALAWVFGRAAFHKLRDPVAFAQIVRGYRLVPDGAAPAIAAMLGVLEVVAVAMLLTPPLSGLGGGLVLGLLAGYSLAIGINLARGRRDVDCGCLGPGHRQPLSAALLVRNAVLAAAAVGARAPASPRSVGWLDTFTVVAGATSVALLLTAAVRLASGAAELRPGRSR